MMSITGKAKRAFTLIEILAVLFLIAIIMGAVVFGFGNFGSSFRTEGSNIVKDLQGTYFTSLRKASVYRMSFSEDKDGQFYTIEKFEFPPPPPSIDDEEAYKAWKEKQEEKDRSLSKLSRDELRARSTVDDGEFKLVKTKRLDNLKVFEIHKVNEVDARSKSIVFYPTGEVDGTLLIFNNDSNDFYSIVVDPMTGQVQSFPRQLSQEEWKTGSYEE